MKGTKMLVILLLGLTVCPVSMVLGAVSLTVNGDTVDAITLKAGQACTVKVESDDSSLYNAYVGFDNGLVLGTFSHLTTEPNAGDLADATEYDVPAFYGYFIVAAGSSPPPSPGVHFVFEYQPQSEERVPLPRVGETELKLYDQTLTTVIDSVHITVLAAEMGTSFTYQGRLMESDHPAEGQYDFEFSLFDAPSYGNQFQNTIETNDIEVIDGYFTAELDFDSDVFDGDSRWLEIYVRPGDSNDPNAFVFLNPRQRVTPTPYSLHTRGLFVDKTKNVGMGTTSPAGKLHVDGGKAEDGRDGSNIVIKAQDGGDAETIGNIGRRGGDIILMPGEGGAGALALPGPDGKVGIGTDHPSATLDVRGNIRVDQKIQAHDSGGLELATDDGVAQITIDDTGNVGIGTTSPEETLDVRGNIEVDGKIQAHGSMLDLATANGSPRLRILDSGDVVVVSSSLNKSLDLRICENDNYGVGIGTSASTWKKLNIYTDTDNYGVYSLVETNGIQYGVFSSVEGSDSGNSYGVYGSTSSTGNQNHGVYGSAISSVNGTNYGVYGIAVNDTGEAYAGYFKGDVYVTKDVSALTYTDRTPYPKDVETAYEAVMSMERLPDGQYDENNREVQLDHSKLSDFVRSKDGNRDLSATVSCHNEVLKDLTRKQQELGKAHIYIEQLHERINTLEAKLVKMEGIISNVQ